MKSARKEKLKAYWFLLICYCGHIGAVLSIEHSVKLKHKFHGGYWQLNDYYMNNNFLKN